MSWITHDQDEWKTVMEARPCTSCGGVIGKCDGRCNGASSISTVRRPKEEVAAIKAERRRVAEDEVLRQADEIRARRAASPGSAER